MTRQQRIALALHRRRVEWIRGEIMPVRPIYEGQGEVELPMRVRRQGDGFTFEHIQPDPIFGWEPK